MQHKCGHTLKEQGIGPDKTVFPVLIIGTDITTFPVFIQDIDYEQNRPLCFLLMKDTTGK